VFILTLLRTVCEAGVVSACPSLEALCVLALLNNNQPLPSQFHKFDRGKKIHSGSEN
jgi:hypothetical protein